jgi:hypothetical protein
MINDTTDDFLTAEEGVNGPGSRQNLSFGFAKEMVETIS